VVAAYRLDLRRCCRNHLSDQEDLLISL
jgi:hypothetical protein